VSASELRIPLTDLECSRATRKIPGKKTDDVLKMHQYEDHACEMTAELRRAHGATAMRHDGMKCLCFLYFAHYYLKLSMRRARL